MYTFANNLLSEHTAGHWLIVPTLVCLGPKYTEHNFTLRFTGSWLCWLRLIDVDYRLDFEGDFCRALLMGRARHKLVFIGGFTGGDSAEFEDLFFFTVWCQDVTISQVYFHYSDMFSEFFKSFQMNNQGHKTFTNFYNNKCKYLKALLGLFESLYFV